MNTPENLPEVGRDALFDVFAIDAELRSMKHALTIVNRLKDRGKWNASNNDELADLRRRYTQTLISRANLPPNKGA